MSTGSDPVDYKEAYEEKCRVAENTRLALMKALARVNRLEGALSGIKNGSYCSACSCTCHAGAAKALEEE